MTDDRPLALDLCSGAGGMTIGLEAAGYRTISFDNWQPAIDTHVANGLECHRLDLMTVGDAFWEGFTGRVDLLAGGPPCQPFSAAGQGLGEYDPRDCVPGFIRAVRLVQPRVFLMENVRGLTFKRHADYLARVLSDLAACGYEIEHRVLSCEEYGVPQTRQRLIILGRRDGEPITWPTPTHRRYRSKVAQSEGDPELLPWVSMAQALGWTEDDVTLISNYGTGGDPRKRGERDGSEPAFTVTSKVDRNRWMFHRPSTTIVGSFRPDIVAAPGYRVKGDPPRQNTPGSVKVTEAEAATLQAFPRVFTGANSMVTGRTGSRAGDGDVQPYSRSIDLPAPTVDTKAGTAWKVSDGESSHRLTEDEIGALQAFPGVLVWAAGRTSGATAGARPRSIDEPSATITGAGTAYVESATDNRRLTEAESAILQAFPDGFTFTGNSGKVFKQIGNAVPPPLAYVIARANVATAVEVAA